MRVVRPAVAPSRKPRAAGISHGPELVAGPLEAEHRVEDVEGDGRLGVRGVADAGGLERGRGAGLGDALLEHLAVLGLAVGQHEVGVDRVVQLAPRGVDTDLAEEGVHAERASLVGHDGHDAAAHAGIAQQVAQQLAEGHRGRRFLRPRAGHELGVHGVARQLDGHGMDHPAGQRPAERRPARLQVLDLRRGGPGGSTGRP